MAKGDYTCEFAMLHVKLEMDTSSHKQGFIEDYMDASGFQHVSIILSSICLLKYHNTSYPA